MTHALRVLAILALLCVGARADTVCVTASFTPDSYSAPPGGSFITYIALENCSSESYIFFGLDIGENPPWDLLAIDTLEFPGRWVAPEESITTMWSYDQWRVDAQPGSVWNATAVTSYNVSQGFCNNNSIPCSISPGEGWLFASFTAVVSQPPSEVPEPGTVLLLATGMVGVAARLRKKRL